MDFSDGKNAVKQRMFIARCRNGNDLVKYINRIYPLWIYDVLDKFEEDLKPLSDNWLDCCRRTNVKPKKILLVEKVVFDPDTDSKEHKVLLASLNHLTKHGFCVREKSDFTACLTEGCNSIILCKEMRNNLYKANKCKRPFTNMCVECIRKMNTKKK